MVVSSVPSENPFEGIFGPVCTGPFLLGGPGDGSRSRDEMRALDVLDLETDADFDAIKKSYRAKAIILFNSVTEGVNQIHHAIANTRGYFSPHQLLLPRTLYMIVTQQPFYLWENSLGTIVCSLG